MGLEIVVKVNGEADAELMGASLVEVRERLGEPTRFSLTYPIDNADGDITLVSDARLGPGAEIAVVVPVEEEEHVLVQGPVHGQRIRLVHGGTGSWIEVTGSDRSVEMDREHKTRVWSDVRASDVVGSIVREYGFTDDVEETREQHEERRHSLVQRDTDLRFVRRLARRYGHLFWITTDAAGDATAHFRRPPVDQEPAARLVINRENPTVANFDVAWDVEVPTSVAARQLDLGDKSVIEGALAASPLTALGAQPLAAIAEGTRTACVIAPVDAVDDLSQRAEGALIEAGWFVRASCDTNLNALGRLVRAHTMVEVEGAGLRHSGKYLVAGVRHAIDAAAHLMELELYRNAWGTE